MTTAESRPLKATQPPASILSKAFEVLSAFGPDHRVLTLTEIARASGLPKSTVHRLLKRLIPLGVIEAHGSGFKVGLPMRRFASAMPIESLRESALPHLAALHRWSGRHVHLGTLRGTKVVFVERFLAPSPDLPSACPGTETPTHATALGKALLAYVTPQELEEALEHPLPALTPGTITNAADFTNKLQQVRNRRIAFARGEFHPEVTCVAAPVLIKGRAVAALSVSTTRHDAAVDRVLADAVSAAADRISRDNQRVLAAGNEIWFPGFD